MFSVWGILSHGWDTQRPPGVTNIGIRALGEQNIVNEEKKNSKKKEKYKKQKQKNKNKSNIKSSLS